MKARALCAWVVLWLTLAGAAPGAEISDHEPRLLKDEWYSEGWDQVAYFPDGSLLIAQVTLTNIGFGDKHAAVFGARVAPDGGVTILKNSRSRGEWEFSPDRLDLEIAGHRFTGLHPDYRFIMDKSTGQIELDLVARSEPWRLGRILENDEGFHYLSFYAPRASVEGRYRFGRPKLRADAPWQPLQNGRGYGARYVYSTAMDELVQDTLRIVPVNDSPVAPVFYFVTDAAGAQRNYVAVFENGGLMFEASEFEIDKTFGFEPSDPKRREIPWSFTLDIRNTTYALSGSVKVQRFLSRIDPVDSLKPFLRTMVKLLNTPIQFRYLVEYRLRLENHAAGQTSGAQELTGAALMDYVVLRRARVSDEVDRR